MKNPKFWATMIVLSLLLSITSSVICLLTMRRAILNREVVQALDVLVMDTQIAEEKQSFAEDEEAAVDAEPQEVQDSTQSSAAQATHPSSKAAQPAQPEQPKIIVGDSYVDLGLPSGTLWKAQNEEGLMAFDDAKKKYGRSIPSIKQWEELKKYCEWEWTGNGYNVTGPSGQGIFIPAAGYRNVSGLVGKVGTFGNYWSSTSKDKKEAWRFGFEPGKFSMAAHSRRYGRSVRLAQKQQRSLEDIVVE